MSDPSPETLSIFANVVLIPAAIYLANEIRKHKTDINQIASQLVNAKKEYDTLQKQACEVSIIVKKISDLVTVTNSAMQDNKIDPTEAAQIIVKVQDLVNCPEVKGLISEFA